MDHLSSRLVNGIMGQIDHVVRNGDTEQTYPGCVNLSFSCIEGESLLMALKDIALSSGRFVKFIICLCCCYLLPEDLHYSIKKWNILNMQF